MVLCSINIVDKSSPVMDDKHKLVFLSYVKKLKENKSEANLSCLMAFVTFLLLKTVFKLNEGVLYYTPLVPLYLVEI